MDAVTKVTKAFGVRPAQGRLGQPHSTAGTSNVVVAPHLFSVNEQTLYQNVRDLLYTVAVTQTVDRSVITIRHSAIFRTITVTFGLVFRGC